MFTEEEHHCRAMLMDCTYYSTVDAYVKRAAHYADDAWLDADTLAVLSRAEINHRVLGGLANDPELAEIEVGTRHHVR